jgi:hypothetical protein
VFGEYNPEFRKPKVASSSLPTKKELQQNAVTP